MTPNTLLWFAYGPHLVASLGYGALEKKWALAMGHESLELGPTCSLSECGCDGAS